MDHHAHLASAACLLNLLQRFLDLPLVFQLVIFHLKISEHYQ